MMQRSAQPTDHCSEGMPALRLVPAAAGVGEQQPPSRRPAGHLQAALLERLDGLVSELDKLPDLTEKSFLTVSANLQGLCGRLQSISKNAGQAALLMSGHDALCVIEGLGHALGCMEDLLGATSLIVDRSITGLCRIIDELEDVQQLVTDFKERARTLRMLQMITNIQGASLTKGTTGFQKVADDIGTLSITVQAKTACMTQKTQALSAELQKAVTMVSALQDSQRKLTSRIIGDIRHAIVTLAGMHEKSALAAEQLAESSETMSHELSEVVMAMQFHDITRQQLEHTRQALIDARVKLITSPGKETTQEISAFSPESVCALQAAQIANSINELKNAITRIGTNLGVLAGDAATTSRNIHSLFGMAGIVGQTSIAEIETGLASVLTAFAESRTVIGHLAMNMQTVTVAMGEVTSFAENIDFIGSEIKLIALNAIIKAVQAGKDGSAFVVIATTVKQESEEICRQASAISASIGRITDHVNSLQAELPTVQSATPEGQEALGDMSGALTTLRRLSENVMGLLAQTDRMATGLATDIEETITCLDNREMKTLLQQEIPTRLNRLVMAVRRIDQVSPDGVGGNALEMFHNQYTMRSERKVHELFAAETFAGHDFSTVIPLADDDLGDNVELF
ncbi:MAG: methyl-accepting chemotaxis protein [Desulfuromonadales bacterium]|nr:methyl-accepting chemotaxis protein [Desulfuromonadales bacterium]